MKSASMDWLITDERDDRKVLALLEHDRIWNSFALADLLPPFRDFTRFITASRLDEKPTALVMIIEHPGFSTVSPFGDADGVAAILSQTPLPSSTLVQATAPHLASIQAVYRPAPAWREMLRMAVESQMFLPQSGYEQAGRLTVENEDEIRGLYALFPESHYRPELLDQDSFYGLREHDHLVAIAGTHVVAERYGIAVVGNVFTHPDERGKGYAGIVTSALVAHLLARGCNDIVLNVYATNAAAIAVYQRLGFQTRHAYWSGPAERRSEESEVS